MAVQDGNSIGKVKMSKMLVQSINKNLNQSKNIFLLIFIITRDSKYEVVRWDRKLNKIDKKLIFEVKKTNNN